MRISMILVFVMTACSAAPAPTASVVGADGTCPLGMQQCPKCGTQGGYYCSRYCMDCPVLEAPLTLANSSQACQ